MEYQNPNFLYLLFAVAIPIIVHLFNLRKNKKIFFTKIKFLKELKLENKKRHRLKEILLLFTRILLISSIILAFSQPYIPIDRNPNINKDNVIYIDNSFSMEGAHKEGNMLEIAKENSLQILNKLDSKSELWILTNKLDAQENKSKTISEAEEYIYNISHSSTIRNIDDILKKIKDISEVKTTYLISDFQKNSSDLDNLKMISKDLIILPLLHTQTNNVSIDSCWFEDPINILNKNVKLITSITNHSNIDVKDLKITLEINNTIKSELFTNLNSRESKLVNLSFNIDSIHNNGIIHLKDIPFSFDNKLYLSFDLNKEINVLQIFDSKKNMNIENIFNNELNINHQSTNYYSINYNIIKSQDIIILNELQELSDGFLKEIKKFVDGGGNLCFIPDVKNNIITNNKFLKEFKLEPFQQLNSKNVSISNINEEHAIFKNVFDSDLQSTSELFKINNYYTVNKKTESLKEYIYTDETGNPFLYSCKYKKGNIYVFNSSFSAQDNEFIIHPLFLPTFYNIVIFSSNNLPLFYNLNDNNEIYLPKNSQNKNHIFNIKSDEIDIIGERKNQDLRRLVIDTRIKEAGHYKVYQGNNLISNISFNNSRKESEIDQHSFSEIKQYINSDSNIILFSPNQNIETNLMSLSKKQEFWKTLIYISLFLFFLEIILIKNLKK
tara:strand:- start:327 stop:2330 length:2004 start_codon:yes stop_codon:yes gene_type:complete